MALYRALTVGALGVGCVMSAGCGNASAPCVVHAGVASADEGAMSGLPYVNGWVLLKSEVAANRCLRIYVDFGDNASYAIAPNNGLVVKNAEITMSASDCVPTAGALPPPMAQTVQATSGNGCFEVSPCGVGSAGITGVSYFNLGAVFEFPSSYSWVPATDSVFATELYWPYPGVDCG